MAQPSPIFVTTSTTLVQVNPLQIPYTPVLLNSYLYAGQVVSVLDGTSSFGAVTNPIVVSTAAASQFTDGSVSTLINQPQGFVTLQSQAPNQWSFLNSFPFRNQYLSAGLLTLNTSTLQVASLSTLQEFTSSLRVENLVVSGNLTQTSPLTINTNLSTFGSVELYSTFTAWGNASFSSGLSTLSAVRFQSTLTIQGNFTTPSSIQMLSSVFVSGSVSVVSTFSTMLVNLSGSLATFRLNVQQSSLRDADIAGSVDANTFVALADLRTGGDIISFLTTTGNLSTMSSMAMYNSLEVTRSTLVQGSLSTLGPLLIQGNLSTGWNTLAQNTIVVGSNVFGGGFVSLETYLSTFDLQIGSAFVRGDLEVNPSLSNITQVERLVVGKSFGVGDILTTSTTIGGNLSTPVSASFWGAFSGESSLTSLFEVSTLQSFSTLQDVYVLGSFSSFGNVSVSGPVSVYNNLNVVSTSYWNQLNTSSSYIKGDLRIVGNLTMTNTLTLSSIVLPSSVTANNFLVSTLYVGYKGYTNTSLISTLYASSIATGGLMNSAFTMDMQNRLETQNLSTTLISTLEFNASSAGPFTYSTLFHTTSSFGIQTIASTNQFESRALAYSLCNLYVAKTLSTKTLYGDNIIGSLLGDATQLSNVQFPAALSTGLTTTSSIISGRITSANTYTSTLNASAFLNYSTLKINDFHFYGNALTTLTTTFGSNYVAAPTSPSNLLVLNPISCYGDTLGLQFKQVVVNASLLPEIGQDTYALAVGGELRIRNISSPFFQLPLAEYRGDVVVTELLGSISVQSLYVSSGLIALSSGSFFLPENFSLVARSTNTIQPSLSTLVLNSTMFVNHNTQRVGILTPTPTFALDVKGTAYAWEGVFTNPSSIVRDKIVSRQPLQNYWYGVGEYTSQSNIRISSDGETWIEDTTPSEDPFVNLCNVAFDGGVFNLQTNSLGARKWVATGALGAVYRENNGIWSNVNYNQDVKRSAFTSVAFNGSHWVMGSYNFNLLEDSLTTLLRSEDGYTFSNSVTGGFGWSNPNEYYGAKGLTWNGSLWVAVGLGSSPLNSIVYSGDGLNWANISFGGFSNEGNGVVYTGCNWVAVGNSGNGQSFAVSSNVTTWSTIGFGFIGAGYGIAWNGSRLVAVGDYSPGFPSILYSDTYGHSWQSATGTLFNTSGASGRCVAWNGSYWLAGGTTGIRKSYDGKTWFQPPGSPSYLFSGLGWSSNALPSLAIGLSTTQSFSSILTTSFSVAVGEDTSLDSNRTIFYSTDTSNWIRAESGYFWGSGRAVVYNGSNLWVAVGEGLVGVSNILYSGSGINWSNAILPAAPGAGNALFYGAVEPNTSNIYISGHSAVVPNIGEITMFYSPDGLTWSATQGQQFTTAVYGISVDSNGGGVNAIAVGEGTINIMRSQDGIGWGGAAATNFFSGSGRAVLFAGGKWVAAGIDSANITLKFTTTPNGAWSNGTGSLFSVAGYGVAYDGTGKWVAVGDSGGGGGTIKYSLNGEAWVAAASGEFDVKARGIAYNAGTGLWIAVGTLEGSSGIKYSGDGLNWSDALSGDFQTTGYGVATTSEITSSNLTYFEQVRFIKDPGPQVLLRDATPYIAYTSTLLNFNNTLSFDINANVITTASTLSTFVSSFFVTGPTIISGFLSTTNLRLNAGFYLGMQNV